MQNFDTQYLNEFIEIATELKEKDCSSFIEIKKLMEQVSKIKDKNDAQKILKMSNGMVKGYIKHKAI